MLDVPGGNQIAAPAGFAEPCLLIASCKATAEKGHFHLFLPRWLPVSV